MFRYSTGGGELMPELRRLTLDFKPDGIQVRTLYKRQHGPGPNTKTRRREVAQLARGGLERALEALEGGTVEDLGTSGFEVREDVFGLPLVSLDSEKQVKKGA
jgi:hypothetical protein